MAKAKDYYVDIQFTTEFTYKVKARSKAEAIRKAKELYDSGEDLYVHSEVFDDEVTNVEQVP
jgi:hypothetical protein